MTRAGLFSDWKDWAEGGGEHAGAANLLVLADGVARFHEGSRVQQRKPVEACATGLPRRSPAL
jgi:hypothetical protein